MSDAHLVEQSEIVDPVLVPLQEIVRQCVAGMKRHFAEDYIGLRDIVAPNLNRSDYPYGSGVDIVSKR